jgi:hypothetical protein
LTVLQTKEDKKAEEATTGNKKQKREFNNKIGMNDNLNSELFGFNAE